MKKSLLFAAAMSLILNSTAFAGTEFYNGGQTGNWSVFGNTGDSSQNPACVAEVTWDDGSKFQLVKDLKDGELYIWFQNYAWNIGDEPGDYQLRLNVYSGNKVVGGNMTYTLVNKNTINIRNLDVDTFIPAFMEMTEIRLLMPGDIGNAFIPLDGSSAAIEKMLACLDAYDKVPSEDQNNLKQDNTNQEEATKKFNI